MSDTGNREKLYEKVWKKCPTCNGTNTVVWRSDMKDSPVHEAKCHVCQDGYIAVYREIKEKK